MAEDDDDDSFGEFTFASNQTTVNSSSQIPVTVGVDNWGDFSFTQNGRSDHNLKSPQPQPQPQPQPPSPPPPPIQPKWEKMKGALPLSLFGYEEEEEEEEQRKDDKSVMPVAGDDGKRLSSSGNSGFVSNNNNEKSNGHLRINDLIANLYGQRQQEQTIKEVDSSNGLEWDFTATNSTASKDPLSKTGSFCSFSSNAAAAAAAGNHGSDDEGGWEFMDAYSDSKSTQNEIETKERLDKTVSQLDLPDGAHGHNDLFSVLNNGVFVESSGVDSKSDTNVQNGFAADINADSKGTTNPLNTNPLGGSFDFDDSFGEFETAFMEQPPKKKELSEGSKYALGSYDPSHKPVDLFAFPNGLSGESHKENSGFEFRQNSVVPNGVVSDLFSQTECKDAKNAPDSQPPGGGADDEKFGKFDIAFSEAGSKPEGFEAVPKNYKEPVPLSIFGIEEDHEADSLSLQRELFKSSTHGKRIQSQTSNLSINDILSDLYSQAEPISSAYHESNPDGNANSLHSTGKEYNSYLVDDDDNFDHSSWEFKDAFSQSKVDSHEFSLEKKLNNCMEFYSSLKDELFVVARHHIHSLQKAQSTVALDGEEMKVAALDKEIQEAFEELHLKDIISAEHLYDHPERDISLNQYIETLHKPDFQVLESEYHISRRLSLAESDLQTAVELINHFTTVLKILTLARKGDPAIYVSVWLKVISACSQELKHGTWIWKQSLEKNVHNEILSEQQGKQFVTALGEIYRAVVILGAAVKFYKPWILLSGANLEEIYALLEECHSLWSTSGLEEVITIKSLLDSISHIQNLEELAIADEVLSQEESQCRLSLLSPGVVPEMKMVSWNGDKYFVGLANLWANLINPEPPNLCVHAG